MKLINKKNFISIVCISFTLIVCGKLLIEKAFGFTDVHYTGNILLCLGFSVIITAALALHFYMQRFPLVPVLAVQYLLVIGTTAGIVKAVDVIAGTATNAMWQMLLSVTIPFMVSAAVYYMAFFRQIKKANDILAEINREKT